MATGADHGQSVPVFKPDVARFRSIPEATLRDAFTFINSADAFIQSDLQLRNTISNTNIKR